MHNHHGHGHHAHHTHKPDRSTRDLTAHGQGDARQNHSHAPQNLSKLIWALSLTLGFALIEAGTGWFAHSLALISDAGHMVTDSAALALALIAQLIAQRPPSEKHSFGFGRSEALAAFINAMAMLALVGWIIIEAIRRFSHPSDVHGSSVMIVAALGLLLNVVVAWMLMRGESNLNTRAALVHVMGDLLGSVAAFAAGAVINLTGWMQIDPILSILVSLLILKSTIGVLRESYHFLMQGVPHHIDYVQVGVDLKAIDGVLSVHDLHVWEMSHGESALTGHLEIRELQDWPTVLAQVKAMLLNKHGIDHITIQAETHEMVHQACSSTHHTPASTDS
ncbi:MAG: zinc transporter zitB [Pseudomonadota bacterium]